MHQNPAPSIGLTFYVVLVAYCCIFTVHIRSHCSKIIATLFNRTRRTLGNYLRRYCLKRLNLSHRWVLFSRYLCVWLLACILLIEYMGWSKWNIWVPLTLWMQGATNTVKVEVDSDAKKTSQSTKSADKSEAAMNPKKRDAGVSPVNVVILLPHPTFFSSLALYFWFWGKFCLWILTFCL